MNTLRIISLVASIINSIMGFWQHNLSGGIGWAVAAILTLSIIIDDWAKND
jgi:hypothetical protein